jgi:hypothetical protein
MEETAPGEPTRFPPPFREVVEKSGSQVVDLTYEITSAWISFTVARQYRTRTGFAFQPSHPGVRRLKTRMELIALYAWKGNTSRAGLSLRRAGHHAPLQEE